MAMMCAGSKGAKKISPQRERMAGLIKTMRNAVRKLRATTDKAAATELLPKVQKMLDKLAKNNIIHKNKAANIKSGVMNHINKLA